MYANSITFTLSPFVCFINTSLCRCMHSRDTSGYSSFLYNSMYNIHGPLWNSKYLLFVSRLCKDCKIRIYVTWTMLPLALQFGHKMSNMCILCNFYNILHASMLHPYQDGCAYEQSYHLRKGVLIMMVVPL